MGLLSIDAAGRISPNSANNPVHALGTLVAQYGYDAVGRLIVAYEATDLGTPAYQTVRFYYDGVRRIQEIVQGQGEDPDVTRAEYVYGPDYVDEFIVQTYNDGLGNQQPLFMLQDGNYNVVALLGQAGQVLEQYVWDPYGTPVVKHTSATPAPVNRVGHQGLFWHSLDGSATFNTPDPAANPTATGLYYNRNRWYAPHLGRFLQRDPNESAMLVLDTLARNGQLAAGLLNAFDPASHFGSGMNLYGYAGSNPITGADPAGLYDPFAEVDNWIDDRVGNALYTLGTLNEAANLGLKASLEVASVLLGLDVFQSVYLMASGQGGFWDAMNIVVSVNPIGRLGKAAGRIGKAFKWMDRAGDSARLTGKASEYLFKIAPYRQARKWTKGFKHEIEAHHILEKRVAKTWGIDPNDVAAVVLPGSLHKQITSALRTATQNISTNDKLAFRRAYEEVYSRFGYTEWVGHIAKYFP